MIADVCRWSVGRSVGRLIGNNGGHASVVWTSLIVKHTGLSVCLSVRILSHCPRVLALLHSKTCLLALFVAFLRYAVTCGHICDKKT